MTIDHSDTVGWPAAPTVVRVIHSQVSEDERLVALFQLWSWGLSFTRRGPKPLWRRALESRGRL